MNEIIVTMISLAFGSFGNNIISHYSGNSKFDLLRSSCMCGEKRLSARELIPVLSYFFLWGRCTKCRAKLPLRYLVIEIVTVLLGFYCYSQYSPQASAFYFLVFFTLFICGIIDFMTFTIPNVFIIALIILAVVKQVLFPFDPDIWVNAGTGIVLSFALIIVNFISVKLSNKEAIGFGDIKLIFSLSLLFNAIMLLAGIWLSALIAIIMFYLLKSLFTRFMNECRVPFGFYMAVGFIFTTLWENRLLQFYYMITGVI